MLSMGGAFTAGILFLEYINTHKPKRSMRLDECLANIYGDYINYAFKERPKLGDTWLMLQNINPEDMYAVMDLIKQLIGELSWADAVYLYTKHITVGCETCAQKGQDAACINCIAQKLLPPTHMYCPNLFTGALG